MSHELRSIHQQSQASLDGASTTIGQSTRIAYGGSTGDSQFIFSGADDGYLYCLPSQRWSVNTQNTAAHQHWRLATANAAHGNTASKLLSDKEISDLSETDKYKFKISTVAYHPESNKAASGTRGGFVFIHLNVNSASEHSTKLLCRLSSEVRSVTFTKDGSQLVVAGDSIRVLTLAESKIRALKINVPHPIVSTELSPCEKWIAVVSGQTGDIGVVPFSEEDNNTASSHQQHQMMSQATQQVSSTSTTENNNNGSSSSTTPAPQMFALPKQLPAELRKDEHVVPLVHWCQVPSYSLNNTDGNNSNKQQNTTATATSTITDAVKEDEAPSSAKNNNNNQKTEIPSQLLLSVPGEGGFKIYSLKVTENLSMSTTASSQQKQQQTENNDNKTDEPSLTITKKPSFCYKLVSIGFVALPFDAQQQQQQQNAAAISKSIISSAMLFPVSKHKIQAIVLSSCKDVASGSRISHIKIDRKFKQPAQEVTAHTCPMSITEFAVNPFVGSLVFGTVTGDVGFVKKFCTVLMHKQEQHQPQQQQEQSAASPDAAAAVVDNNNNKEQDAQNSNSDGDDDDHDPYLDDETDTNDDSSIADGSHDEEHHHKNSNSKHDNADDNKNKDSLDEDDLEELLLGEDGKKKNKKDKKNKNKKSKKYDFSSSSAEESDIDGLLDDLIASAPKYVSSSRRRRVRRNDAEDNLLRSMNDDDNHNTHGHDNNDNNDKKKNSAGISSVLLDSDDEYEKQQRLRRGKTFVDDEAEEGDSSESEVSSEDGFDARGKKNSMMMMGNKNNRTNNNKKTYGALEDDMLDVDEDEDEFADDEEDFFENDDEEISGSRRRRRGRGSADSGLFFSTANPASLRLMQQQLAMMTQNSGSWEDSFQIGATEPDENGFMYHSFNNIGVIRSNPETSIAFHDKSKSIIRINRPGLVCYGSLGLYGAAVLISNEAPSLDSIKVPGDDEEAENNNNNQNETSTNNDENENNNNKTTQEQDLGDSPEVEERKRREAIRNQRRHSIRLEKAKKESSSFELYFRAFSGVGSQPDWHMPIPVSSEGSIRSLAVGKRFIALFTEKYLRLFSFAGWERGVVGIPHSVVCASGYNTFKAPQIHREYFDPLMYVFQEAPGSALSIRVLNVEKEEECVKPVQLPLSMVRKNNNNSNNNASAFEAQDDSKNNKNNSAAAPLSWLGFSDDGTICLADEVGTVFCHTSNWGGSFQPICEPHRAGETSSPWVWHVTEDKIWCFKNNNSNRTSINIFSMSANDNNESSSVVSVSPSRARLALSYPPVTIEIPTPDMMPMRVPALGAGILNDTVWALRQHYLRLSAKANDLKRNSEFYTEAIAKLDVQLDAILLRLFEIELKDERVGKAVDLATYFQLTDTLEKATRYAHEHNHHACREKLILLLQYRTKNKKKRVCTLPLPGSMVSEKERDRLLRQLLANTKHQVGSSSTTASANNTQNTQQHSQMMMVTSNNVPLSISPQKTATQQHQSQVAVSGGSQHQTQQQPLGVILPSPKKSEDPYQSVSASVPTMPVVANNNNNNRKNAIAPKQQSQSQATQSQQQQQQQKSTTATKFSDMKKNNNSQGTSSSSKPGNFFSRATDTKTSTVTSQPSSSLLAANNNKMNMNMNMSSSSVASPGATTSAAATAAPPSPPSPAGTDSNLGVAQQSNADHSNNNNNNHSGTDSGRSTDERPSSGKQVSFNLPEKNNNNQQQQQKQQREDIVLPPAPAPMAAMPSSGKTLDQLVSSQKNNNDNQQQQSETLKNTLRNLGNNDDDEDESGNTDGQDAGVSLSFF